MSIYRAFFYQPNGGSQDGWRPRKTVACDSTGHAISRFDYDEVIENKWMLIGYYKLGDEPDGIWDPARVRD